MSFPVNYICYKHIGNSQSPDSSSMIPHADTSATGINGLSVSLNFDIRLNRDFSVKSWYWFFCEIMKNVCLVEQQWYILYWNLSSPFKNTIIFNQNSILSTNKSCEWMGLGSRQGLHKPPPSICAQIHCNSTCPKWTICQLKIQQNTQMTPKCLEI